MDSRKALQTNQLVLVHQPTAAVRLKETKKMRHGCTLALWRWYGTTASWLKKVAHRDWISARLRCPTVLGAVDPVRKSKASKSLNSAWIDSCMEADMGEIV